MGMVLSDMRKSQHHPLEITHSYVDLDSHRIHGSLGSPESASQVSIMISLAAVIGLMVVACRPRYSVCIVSDIAIFVLKRDVKLQLTN